MGNAANVSRNTVVSAVAGSVLRIFSGVLTDELGFAAYFALTAAFALPAFALIPRASRWLEE